MAVVSSLFDDTQVHLQRSTTMVVTLQVSSMLTRAEAPFLFALQTWLESVCFEVSLNVQSAHETEDMILPKR